jgi:hypothetical protein
MRNQIPPIGKYLHTVGGRVICRKEIRPSYFFNRISRLDSVQNAYKYIILSCTKWARV